ncbi:MAG: PepSY-like domain-containing protein [Muribaculaceae bacterium]|nr:PepSY-like domain-containing protein [Muribaculaceae bacterium]
MKKLLLILTLVMTMTVGVSARDDYSRDASILPTAAKTTISKNFKADVSLIKIEKTLGHIKEYEVILTDGTEISFDSKGNWENIETPNNKSVPSNFIPNSISEFVKKNQSGAKIVGIEKDHNGYDIELSNGIEMKFDKNGNFKRYDD